MLPGELWRMGEFLPATGRKQASLVGYTQAYVGSNTWKVQVKTPHSFQQLSYLQKDERPFEQIQSSVSTRKYLFDFINILRLASQPCISSQTHKPLVDDTQQESRDCFEVLLSFHSRKGSIHKFILILLKVIFAGCILPRCCPSACAASEPDCIFYIQQCTYLQVRDFFKAILRPNWDHE